jgi:hypothetical protein
MFGADMDYEYLSLCRELDCAVPELFRLDLNAVDSTFLLELRRAKTRVSRIAEYGRLKASL